MTPRKTAFFTTSDGAKLYYECYGDQGPVLVLTYGIACLMNHWHPQIEDFSKDHRILIYDIRGHHKSELGDQEITVDLLAQDCVELLNEAFSEDTKAHFWGHSFGAPIALRVGSIFPERVESIVFVNGFYKNPFGDFLTNEQCLQAVEALNIFSDQAPELSQWLWSRITNNVLFRYLAGVTGGFNLERVSYKDIEIYSKGLSVLPFSNFLENFKALINFDGSPYLSKTVAPVLVVQGDRDGLIPEHLNTSLVDQLPNGELCRFSEGSHCTQLDLPAQLNRKIRIFEEKLS